MPKYVWSGKDKSGKTVIRELTAETSGHAKDLLLAEGLTHLELIEDEFITAAHEGFPEKTRVFGEEFTVTTEERLKHRRVQSQTFTLVVARFLWEDKQYFIIMALVVGMLAYTGRTNAAIGWAIVGLLWPMFRLWASLPGIYYQKLNEAKDWSRWEEVLNLTDTLWKIRRLHFIKMPPSELGRSRAQALIGLGKLDEGLAEFQHYKAAPEMHNWLFKAHLAGLYDVAKLHDRALEYTLEAIREQPAQTLYIDLLNRYVRYHKDTIKAREALAKIEQNTMVELAKPFFQRALGILAYLERDYTSARNHLKACLELMKKNPHQPFRDGHIACTQAYLCCVYAKMGDLPSAKASFAAAKKYLIATREHELLEACQNAIAAQDAKAQ